MINEQIRDKEVRVIGEDGEQLGIMSSKEALKLADEAGLDLVKIAPTAKPPVCKIVDYGKFKYDQMRKEKEAARRSSTLWRSRRSGFLPISTPMILIPRSMQPRSSLPKGDRVKVTLRFRGREMAHMANSKHILDDFAEKLFEI